MFKRYKTRNIQKQESQFKTTTTKIKQKPATQNTEIQKITYLLNNPTPSIRNTAFRKIINLNKDDADKHIHTLTIKLFTLLLENKSVTSAFYCCFGKILQNDKFYLIEDLFMKYAFAILMVDFGVKEVFGSLVKYQPNLVFKNKDKILEQINLKYETLINKIKNIKEKKATEVSFDASFSIYRTFFIVDQIRIPY